MFYPGGDLSGSGASTSSQTPATPARRPTHLGSASALRISPPPHIGLPFQGAPIEKPEAASSSPRVPLCVRPKSLQSCPTLCDPLDCSPPGSSKDFPGKNIEMGCYALLQGTFPIFRIDLASLNVSYIGRWVLYH